MHFTLGLGRETRRLCHIM